MYLTAYSTGTTMSGHVPFSFWIPFHLNTLYLATRLSTLWILSNIFKCHGAFPSFTQDSKSSVVGGREMWLVSWDFMLPKEKRRDYLLFFSFHSRWLYWLWPILRFLQIKRVGKTGKNVHWTYEITCEKYMNKK